MPLAATIKHLHDNAALLGRDITAHVAARLAKALQIRGDFPTSLNLLKRIQQAASAASPETSALVALLQVDQVLALRLMSIANYEYYRSGPPAVTLAQAVEHLGPAKLPEVIANLAEAKNFNAIFLARATALTMMQQSMLASVVAQQTVKLLYPEEDLSEQTYLLHGLVHAPPLMLAAR